MSARPSFQFYPRDWLTCPELRRCSVAARGLWADLLALAHFGDPYGHLASTGRPYDAAELARLTGCSKSEVVRLIGELERNGVFSRDERGAILSRRMVRDGAFVERRSKIGEANGRKGAEFGHLGAEYGQKGGRPRNGGKNPPHNPGRKPRGKPGENPHPSSASASASAEHSSPSARSDGVAHGAPHPQPHPIGADSDPGPDPPPKPRRAAAPSSSASRLVSDAFCAAFERSRGERYVWQGAKDGKLLAALLAQFSGDVAMIQRRIDAFLADPFWGPKADFATFCAKHNAVAGAERGPHPSSSGQRSVLDVIASAGRAPAGAA